MAIKSSDGIPVTFANLIVSSGSWDGVVNVNFGACEFNPGEKDKVEPDLVTVSRIRMTISCAKQLRDSLISIVGPPAPKDDVPVAPDETASSKEAIH